MHKKVCVISLVYIFYGNVGQIVSQLVSFFFFFRKKLIDFINVIQLHPIVKSKQYVMGHLPSILENLVCIMHFQPDYEQPYCCFSKYENTTILQNCQQTFSLLQSVNPLVITYAPLTSKLESVQENHLQGQHYEIPTQMQRTMP